jgi:uncharacterized membrane protein
VRFLYLPAGLPADPVQSVGSPTDATVVRRTNTPATPFFSEVASYWTMQKGDPQEGVLTDLPPSSKLVYKTLEWNGRLTQQQIVDESLLSGRTVRDAVARLEEHDIVERQVHYRDARQNVYRLAEA